MKKFWNVFRWFLLAYFVYAVVKSPEAAAGMVRTLFQIIGDAFRGIVGVFDTLPAFAVAFILRSAPTDGRRLAHRAHWCARR